MIGTYNGLCSHSDAMSFIAFNDLYGFSLVWPHVPTVVTVLFRTQCLFGPLERGALGGPLPCNPGPARALPTRLSVLSVRYPGVVQLRLPLGLCPRNSLTADDWSLLSALDFFRCLVHWCGGPLVAPCPATRARPGLCLDMFTLAAMHSRGCGSVTVLDPA